MKKISLVLTLAAMTIIHVSFGQSTPSPEQLPVPQPFKVTREGAEPKEEPGPVYHLNQLHKGTDKLVFIDCRDEAYVAFKLLYDVHGHANTTQEWTLEVDLALLHAEDTLWKRPLRLEMANQTFISTVFHEQSITCLENYHFAIARKDSAGILPSEFIDLKILFFDKLTNEFVPSTTLDFDGTYDLNAHETWLSWSFPENQPLREFDIEWVFVDSTDLFSGDPEEAFKYREPVRISTPSFTYKHLAYYPSGKIWYRARAVGYNPEYPQHRILGDWNYLDNGIHVKNHQPDMTWQEQVVYAEDGKSKTLMHYFDENLRQRQSLTNLSSQEITLVAESLYDFEGRSSVNILPVPAMDASLTYHPQFNFFESLDADVAAGTSPIQQKFHYDNHRLENSILSDSTGAGNYYSGSSDYASIHKDLIPDGEGYVYSQTEYMRDGTGRISKQSGVGKEFKTDGEHTTRYHFGEATQEELVRLFGTNVGNSAHYKKNLVVDPNGQGSVSYLDQEGRVIATALAGEKPSNVSALASYSNLSTDLVTVNMMHRNTVEGNVSRSSQRILNVAPTGYIFKYSLGALASEIENFGCPDCNYSISLSLTDPDGLPVSLRSFAGNEANTGFNYERNNITANCIDSTIVNDIVINDTLTMIGEYTFTKTLIVHELSFEQMRALATQNEEVQQKVQQLTEQFTSDPSDCETCVESCPNADLIIDEVTEEIAKLDCENIMQRILEDLGNHSNDPDSVTSHALYCQYLLCNQNVTSDIFDRKLARIQSWSEAQQKFPNVLDSDPFFNDPVLSGIGKKSDMTSKLSNVSVGLIGFDSDGDGEQDDQQEYSGTIAEATDPANINFYIDENGKPDTVNGRHLLYLDIMSRQSALGEAAYQEELSRQRWTMYRTFYLEAKRKTKLEIAAYGSCDAAKAQLQITDELKELDTEEEIADWAKANGALGFDSVSNESIDLAFENIRSSCNARFSTTDSLLIRNHLFTYFSAESNNVFRLILLEDVEGAPLSELDQVLSNYGCNLSKIAVPDPLQCVQDTTVIVNTLLQGQFGQQLLSKTATLAEARKNSDELNSLFKKRIAESDSLLSLEIRSEILDNVQEQQLSQKVNGDIGGTQVSTFSQDGILPQEVEALRDLYNSAGGNGWWQQTGWNGLSAEVTSVEGWYGIAVDAQGHVTELNLNSNFLYGSLPSSLGDLIYLKVLDVSNNGQLRFNMPTSIGQLINLETLNLRNTNIYSIPATIDGAANLKKIDLRDMYSISSLPDEIGSLLNLNELLIACPSLLALPSTIGSLANLQILEIKGNYLTTMPDLANLTSLESLVLSGSSLIVPNEIGSLSSLKSLTIANTGATSLPFAFTNLTQLEKLNLRYNDLTILPSMDGLTNLESFDAMANSIVGFPDEITGCTSLETLVLSSNSLNDSLPDNFGDLHNLKILNLSNANLTGTIPHSFGSLINLTDLNLEYNNLTGRFPVGFGKLTKLELASFAFNNLKGSLPNDIGNLKNLITLSIYDNDLEGYLPDGIGGMTALEDLDLFGNELKGYIPTSISALVNLRTLDLSDNNLSGVVPSFEGLTNLYSLRISNNALKGPLRFDPLEWTSLDFEGNNFTFSDFMDVFSSDNWECGDFGPCMSYSPQGLIDRTAEVTFYPGNEITLTTDIDRSVSPACQYQWFKYLDGANDIALNSRSASGHTVTIQNASASDGGSYYYTIVHNGDEEDVTYASDLILRSRMRNLVLGDSSKKSYDICLKYDKNNPTIQKFTVNIEWNELFLECRNRAQKEDSLLVAYATEKLVEEYLTNFYSKYRTQCLSGINEDVTYSYIPKEYHYTLYYYDQAANLVQTVPPNGVHPLTTTQVKNFDSDPVDPPHTFLTRYKYNSLNQLVWLKTPDANESQFWYNDKGQLKVSQNAQQLIDSAYSYTKYDEQGRIVEVGELKALMDEVALKDSIENRNFPSGNVDGFVLSDITRTHYDFGKQEMDEDFEQKHLRSRVSYVEVIEKNATDTIATYYSYDIHGNVKSLLQQVPGLDPKRTDYVYDLISGKVNYVMYQYGMSDQFIHKYEYDEDNRLTTVRTSTDGFIWDRDASYMYYAHGPLARVELGEYRVQGLDYYYTLQGWIKGVNQPYADDPDVENIHDLGVAKDVFAYTLGYFEGDYKPINNNFTPADNRDHLWTRLDEVNHHNGLYNGNISWMITDLAKIGEVNNNRAKGMQAMLYQYDQLHRITKSGSLTSYVPGSGFESKSSAAYDEDYTYDTNGNLLTLQRRNDQGNMLNDFDYQYYPNTNRLRQVEPPEDKVYNGGAIVSNTELYRKVTIQGNAYVPQGKPVEIRVLEEIEMDPEFNAPDGTDFWAHIVADSGMYQYDAIGNLVLDQYDGVKISWTPYGKVREVKTKSDSVTVTFRYDGTGNRIEKRVTKFDTTYVTNYVRDVSGNVMTIYNNTMLAEQPIYGSSRVGMYRGGRDYGQRNLGEKNYELSNHLGNVLLVIGDDIGMYLSDSIWTNVNTASDYYPFGLEMTGRTWNDTASYRYGFNGKEKDKDEEFGNTMYDYGFRIYSPIISRFLSTDPLFKEFPWNSPYAFAENDVIRAIDIEGAEKLIVSAKAQALFTYIRKLSSVDIVLQRTLIGEISKDELKNKVHVYLGVSSSSYVIGNGRTLHAKDLMQLADFVSYYERNPNSKPKDPDLLLELTDAQLLLRDLGLTTKDIYEKNKKGINLFAVVVREPTKNDKAGAKTYAHEVDLHLKDAIDGNKTTTGEEHVEGFGKEYYMKKNSDTMVSPNDEDVPPSSKMGKLYKRIDDADKKVKQTQ